MDKRIKKKNSNINQNKNSTRSCLKSAVININPRNLTSYPKSPTVMQQHLKDV